VTTSVLIQKTNSMLQLMSPLIVPQRVSGGKIIRVNSTAIMEKDQLFQDCFHRRLYNTQVWRPILY
jgi:hypothetical protein